MGEADTETPAAEYVEKLDAIKKAAPRSSGTSIPRPPIAGIASSSTARANQCPRPPCRVSVSTVGDEDSERRLFEFLGKAMPRPRGAKSRNVGERSRSRRTGIHPVLRCLK